MKRLLVLSNGAGEDAIAAQILSQLRPDIAASVVCCPLVGPGRALHSFELCGPRVLPPSEGLFRESWRLAARDLLAGVVAGHWRQLQFLRQQRDHVALTVAVGDLFPVLWAGLAGLGNLLFVGTAKSVFHHPYSWPERAMLKAWATSSVVRDEPTAQRLREQGLAARWLGNSMMDELAPIGCSLPFHRRSPLLTLFPGSRSQAPSVLPFQLRAVMDARRRFGELQVGVATAPGVELEELAAQAVAEGWLLYRVAEPHHLGWLERDGCQVHFLRGCLGDLLNQSQVALGQAGTANEQAAGCGVPVIAYDTREVRRLRWYRKRQKGLLGDAVTVVSQTEVALSEELCRLLHDDSERERRAAIGRERMGPAGGSQRMASAIAELWDR